MLTIPAELKNQVHFSVTILGKAIKNLYGDSTFKLIESIRKELVGMHNVDNEKQFTILYKISTQLKAVKKSELSNVAHAYLTMLELINRCEAAHRIFKLNSATKKPKELITKLDQEIIYVLTSHPTEAKSPMFLENFEKIQKILVKLYDVSENKKILELELYHLLYLALSIPAAKNKAPKVDDEAHMIYSFLLNPKLLDKVLAADLPIYFRTWVGGDKDGHPGVDHRTLKDSLTLSRSFLIQYVRMNLEKLLSDSKLLTAPKIDNCKKSFKALTVQLNQLKRILPKDYVKVEKFKKAFLASSAKWHKEFGEKNFNLVNIEKIFVLYPQLVVPIEVREDSDFVREALTSRKTFAIVKMLQLIKSISSFNTCKAYVRGFILSMVETEEDLFNGAKLTKKIFGSLWLPVVPLFENRKALENCVPIIKAYLKSETVEHHQKFWHSNFEIMLGYSDSAKECGVFPSRVLIYEAMRSLDLLLRDKKLHPVFFHGSGGSVERGGGTIDEQTAAWPLSALRIVKTTIQGEMVARNFSSSEILISQTQKFEQKYQNPSREESLGEIPAVIKNFAKEISQKYEKLIKEDFFWEMVEKATPYNYLGQLKIGSRPTKRKSKKNARKLRAIPWILCWTQVRILFPVWWGTGTTWANLSATDKKALKDLVNSSTLLSSFVKQLGFTLAKVELPIWKIYLTELAGTNKDFAQSSYELFSTEYNKAVTFFQEITGETNFLWFRPWMKESIDLRAPMIHPINLIQILAMKSSDNDLLRKSVTGIACGMMTTG